MSVSPFGLLYNSLLVLVPVLDHSTAYLRNLGCTGVWLVAFDNALNEQLPERFNPKLSLVSDNIYQPTSKHFRKAWSESGSLPAFNPKGNANKGSRG